MNLFDRNGKKIAVVSFINDWVELGDPNGDHFATICFVVLMDRKEKPDHLKRTMAVAVKNPNDKYNSAHAEKVSFSRAIRDHDATTRMRLWESYLDQTLPKKEKVK